MTTPARNVRRLSDETTGDCPNGCGNVAYPYTCDGLDGYFDAAPGCAVSMAEDTLEFTEHMLGSARPTPGTP